MTTALKYSLLKWWSERLHRNDGAFLWCTSAKKIKKIKNKFKKKPEGRCWKHTVNCRSVLKEIIPHANERFNFFFVCAGGMSVGVTLGRSRSR